MKNIAYRPVNAFSFRNCTTCIMEVYYLEHKGNPYGKAAREVQKAWDLQTYPEMGNVKAASDLLTCHLVINDLVT